MSTLAAESPAASTEHGRLWAALRWLDLPILAVGLAAFLIAGLALWGYAACAGAWLLTRALQELANRNTVRALARGDRRSAMGLHAAAMLARIWILAATVLVVGVIEREAGLAAAVLAAILVGAYLGGNALAQLVTGEEAR